MGHVSGRRELKNIVESYEPLPLLFLAEDTVTQSPEELSEMSRQFQYK